MGFFIVAILVAGILIRELYEETSGQGLQPVRRETRKDKTAP